MTRRRRAGCSQFVEVREARPARIFGAPLLHELYCVARGAEDDHGLMRKSRVNYVSCVAIAVAFTDHREYNYNYVSSPYFAAHRVNVMCWFKDGS